MDIPPHQPRAPQVVQRVKVGMTGLAIVLLLIVLASVLVRSAGRERASVMAGASRADLAGNLAQANAADATSEPLAEIGVAPSGQGNDSTVAGPGKTPR